MRELHIKKFWRRVAKQGLLGFVFGYLVVHPVSMVIFHWLDFSRDHQPFGMSGNPFLDPLVHSFHLDMLPMGIAFGLVSALLAGFNGWYRAIIVIQRDCLARQLNLNEKYQTKLEKQASQLKSQNLQLVQLEETIRRNTRFMVHDFKNHLGCIIEFSNMLLQRKGDIYDEVTIDALERMRRQASQMMGSVFDLLDLAALKERREIRKTKVRVEDLILEAANDFSLPEQRRQIQLGEGRTHCPLLWGNARMLKRVLANLISNALKHNQEMAQVIVDAEVDRDREEIVFSCCDDGHGVSPEVLPALFEMFETGNSEANDSTGLGLAFCRAAVEAHGGRIWCESVEREGACFFFTIPTINGAEGNDHEKENGEACFAC